MESKVTDCCSGFQHVKIYPNWNCCKLVSLVLHLRSPILEHTKQLILVYHISSSPYPLNLVIGNSIFRWFHKRRIVRGLAINIRWSRFSGTIGIGLLSCLVVGVLGIKGDTAWWWGMDIMLEEYKFMLNCMCEKQNGRTVLSLFKIHFDIILKTQSVPPGSIWHPPFINVSNNNSICLLEVPQSAENTSQSKTSQSNNRNQNTSQSNRRHVHSVDFHLNKRTKISRESLTMGQRPTPMRRVQVRRRW